MMRGMRTLLVGLMLLAPALARAEPPAAAPPGEDEQQLAQLEQTVADDAKQLHVEEGKTNALSAKALSLEQELMAALAQKEALQKKADALTQQLTDATAQLAQANGKLSAATAQLAALQKQFAALTAKETALEARVEKLEQDLAVASAGKAASDQRVEELEAKLLELTKENGALQATVDSTKGALLEAQRRKAEADARVAEFRALIAKFKALIDAGELKVKIVDGRMEVELATDVLFASGSARLSRGGHAAIVQVTQVLAGIADRQYQIEGHTDDVPIHTAAFPSNWELAAARAITVVKTMLASGMPPARISAASYADVRPAVPNDTQEGRSANRRIEITVMPDLTSLPGFDELSRIAAGH